MSVKIEILDYKYLKNNLLTWSNSSTTGWSTGTGITAVSNTTGTSGILIESTAGTSGQYSGFYSTNLTLQNNHSYTFTYTCSSLDDAGQTGSDVFIKGTGGGVGSYRPFGNEKITVGTHSYTFTMDTSQNNGVGTMDVYFQMTSGNLANKQVKIKNVKLVNNTLLSDIDWDNSVVGELDVTDHSDFPLAMTFQISDIKDLTSTSGDYSKTFKIPATKNNNKLLKNPYIPNIDTEVNINENKKCRILVNNLFSITGLIKITGVSGYGETPSHYDCVFFGNNLSWADDLSNLYMHELNWGVNSEGLEYNKTSIMATWQDEDCDSSTSPIVYPITSYGDYNPDGEPKTIQLLDTHYGHYGSVSSATLGYYGHNNGGDFYDTPLPTADWRPAVFVKDTLEKIFAKAGDGYKINSTFMETDMFKKLVWLLPNFKYNNAEERYDDNAFKCDFNNYSYSYNFDVCGSSTDVTKTANILCKMYKASISETNGSNGINYYYTGGGTEDLGITTTNTNIILDENSMLDYGTDEITIREYGYYDVQLNGLQGKVASVQKGGGVNVVVEDVWSAINIEVQTVGQTSWNIIEQSYKKFTIGNYVDSACARETNWADMSSVSSKIWFNKGDKIKLTKGIKLTSANASQNFILTTLTKATSSNYFSLNFNSESVDYGQTYDLKDVINKDYKSLDFIKGIAHAFNLKMTTDEVTRVVNIEPFNSFYKDYAEAIDWTYKLDRSKQIDDKWIKSDLKRDIVFQYKPDSKDKKVEVRGETYWDGIKDEYPYQETLPKTFEKGESKYENPFFAGTYNAKDQDNLIHGAGWGSVIPNPYSACLWEGTPSPNDSYRPDKGYEFLPRLLYWNKYSPVGAILNQGKFASVQTWANTTDLILPYPPPLGVLSGIYPQATSINRDDSSSPILSYGNVNVRDYDDTTGIYTSYAAGKGLFATYYKNMFEMLKAKPRLRTVYVDLKVKDIITLDFTKLIYIDGVYWRINKVVDYQPNKNQSTKVELVEWMSLGAFAATAPSFGGNDNTGGLGWQDGGVETDNDDIGL